MFKELNETLPNYKKSLEEAIPAFLDVPPFADFDPQVYARARTDYINESCKTLDADLDAIELLHDDISLIFDKWLEALDFLITHPSWKKDSMNAFVFENEDLLSEFNRLYSEIFQAFAKLVKKISDHQARSTKDPALRH